MYILKISFKQISPYFQSLPRVRQKKKALLFVVKQAVLWLDILFCYQCRGEAFDGPAHHRTERRDV